jgi:hypothetical protein
MPAICTTVVSVCAGGNHGAAGERELDSDWQPLPATFVGQGLTLLRVQCKSTVAADDPVFRRCQMGLR